MNEKKRRKYERTIIRMKKRYFARLMEACCSAKKGASSRLFSFIESVPFYIVANISRGRLSSLPGTHAMRLTGMYFLQYVGFGTLQPFPSNTAGLRPREEAVF